MSSTTSSPAFSWPSKWSLQSLSFDLGTFKRSSLKPRNDSCTLFHKTHYLKKNVISIKSNCYFRSKVTMAKEKIVLLNLAPHLGRPSIGKLHLIQEIIRKSFFFHFVMIHFCFSLIRRSSAFLHWTGSAFRCKPILSQDNLKFNFKPNFYFDSKSPD